MAIRAQVIDVETENHEWYGELASPRCPDNYVVMQGQRDCVLTKDGWEFYKREEYRYASREDWLANKSLHLHPDTNILVAHNAPYELSWWFEHYGDEFRAFLLRGGRVFCTAYAEYLLTHQQSQYPSLNETAPKYGGTHKVDAVKAMWESGYLTSQIDQELLSEYLSGPSGDIENTTKLFVGQWNELTKQGMLPMALTRFEGMLMWAYMMHSGLHVDREVAERNRRELQDSISGLTETLLGYLPADMPKEAREQFKFTSAYHMSAFVFGGVMKYKARVERRDADGNLIYVKVDAPLFKRGKDKWLKHTSECVWDDETGLWYDPVEKVHQTIYSSGKHKGEPKFEKLATDEVDTKWGEVLFRLPGLLRVQDRRAREIADNLEWEDPKRPGEYLRRTGDWVGKRKLADGSPVFSTAGEVLDILAARKIPGVVEIADRAKAQKDLGTYYLSETFDEDGNVTGQSGMMQFIQPDSIVHHTINMTATETTRLSSQRPNSQNLPRKGTSKVKQMFTSRFGEGGRIVEADYSALEVVGLAGFSKDKNLIRALLDGIDMHCMRLSAQLNEPYEDVLKKCKDESHPEHARYSQMRTDIKPKAFSYQYGATARGIAYSTGCSEEEAQAFIDNEKGLFPEVEEWFDAVIFPAVERSGQSNVFKEQDENGRWQVYRRGHFRSPGGTCYSFRQYEKWNKAARAYLMEYKPTQMRNYPIQGETAFWVQGIGGLLFRWLLANDFFGGRVVPINQVHDAFYFDVAPDCPHEFFVGLKAIMESIPEYYNHIWPEYNLTVPFPAEVEAGPSMYEKHHVETTAEEVLEFKRNFLTSKGISI
ncbi:DNA polymerase [Enterobacter kobei]|uniref:DNA polymerase n=1 Tax=Enterobacter kobei TaxID=208224 RepID=UPI0021095C05|nr:DNA polymerase [Enterobacter kobei]MCQ4359534.1 DNA polymerase [Enterobacter kobei]HDC4630200.1 hypothetical protein [Enterobacter kobei]HDC4671432.1 hypothetical protein [Enterobacter kobei]